MTEHITLLLITSVLSLVSLATAQRQCRPPTNDGNFWATVGRVHYAYTDRNVRKENAQSACARLAPGRSQIAQVRSGFEWRGIKQVIAPDWYWFNNSGVSRLVRGVRHFEFDKQTRLYRRIDPSENCMVYIYPGDVTTDMYCGMDWARALCEIRC